MKFAFSMRPRRYALLWLDIEMMGILLMQVSRISNRANVYYIAHDSGYCKAVHLTLQTMRRTWSWNARLTCFVTLDISFPIPSPSLQSLIKATAISDRCDDESSA